VVAVTAAHTVELPSVYRSTEEAAAVAQTTHRRLRVAELGLPLAGVGFGLIASHVRWFGIPGALAAACLGLLRLLQLAARAESDWHQARTSAEAIKAHAWRYAVRAAEFDGSEIGAADAEHALLAQLRGDIADDSEFLASLGGQEVTPSMRSLREAPLADRRSTYLAERVEDQRAWYAEHAVVAHRQAVRLDVVHYCLDLTAVGSAIAVTVTAADALAAVLTVASASAGAILAWAAYRRYSLIAELYGDTALELELMRERFDDVDAEPAWRALVEETEDRLASEHARWIGTATRLRR
jgi:hypothetical protein